MGLRDPKDQRIEELEAQVAKLTELLAKAMARIAELEERLNRNSTNSSKPPSTDLPGAERRRNKPTGKKAGGQPGHPKHDRVFLTPDRVTHLKAQACCCCGDALHGNDPNPERHQVVEYPKVKPEVDDFFVHSLSCQRCGAITRAELPPGIPSRGYGPRFTALVSLWSGKYRMSKRMIQALFMDLMGVAVSLGTISNLEQEMSAALAAPYEEAAPYVREQAVANADESGWFEGRKNGRAGRAWLWVVTTALVTVFRIAHSRGADVARELLGCKFAGLLGTDRWSAYTWVDPARRQLCWSHLDRDFESFVDRQDAGANSGQRLLQASTKMFRLWHRVRDGTLTRAVFQEQMRPVRKRILALLREASVCPARKTAGMAKKILELKNALFTFVDFEGIEPTNNVSERKVRHGVMWRKTSFGTQSAGGSRFVERILTADATLRQQKRDVLEFLTAAYRARLCRASPPSLLPA